MGVERAIDMTATQRRTVLTLLGRHLPDTEAWAYGSRVKWTARPQSDLDLVVFATPEQRRRVGALREAFEESDLPFRVDLFVWDDVPEAFRQEIESEHVVFSVPSALTRSPEAGDWIESTLGDEMDFVSGGTPSKSCAEYWGGAIPWVSAKDMKYFRLHDTEDHVTDAGVDNGTKLVPEGSVLLLVRGMRLVNDVPICVAQRPMTFNQDVKALRPKSRVKSQYLPYLLLGNKQRLLSLVDLAGHGTGRLNSDELKALDILLPTPSEQRHIARILCTLDDKIELNRRINTTLEAMACAVFKSWFVDFDPVRAKIACHSTCPVPEAWDLFPSSLDSTGIPAGWSSGTIGKCFHLTMGQSPPGSTYNDRGEGIPFFQGRSDFGFRYPTNRKYCSAPSRIAETDDTLVSVRAPVGDINLAWEKSCVGRGVAALRHKSGSRSFTYYSTRAIQNELKYYEQTGTVFGAINRKQFEALRVVEPTPEIISLFEETIGPFDSYIRKNVAESRILAQTRDQLLPKLIFGDIRLPKAENPGGEACTE